MGAELGGFALSQPGHGRLQEVAAFGHGRLAVLLGDDGGGQAVDGAVVGDTPTPRSVA